METRKTLRKNTEEYLLTIKDKGKERTDTFINPFLCNAPFLYPFKTSKNLQVY